MALSNAARAPAKAVRALFASPSLKSASAAGSTAFDARAAPSCADVGAWPSQARAKRPCEAHGHVSQVRHRPAGRRPSDRLAGLGVLDRGLGEDASVARDGARPDDDEVRPRQVGAESPERVRLEARRPLEPQLARRLGHLLGRRDAELLGRRRALAPSIAPSAGPTHGGPPWPLRSPATASRGFPSSAAGGAPRWRASRKASPPPKAAIASKTATPRRARVHRAAGDSSAASTSRAWANRFAGSRSRQRRIASFHARGSSGTFERGGGGGRVRRIEMTSSACFESNGIEPVTISNIKMPSA